MKNGRDPAGPVGTGAPTEVSTPFGTPPDLPTANTSTWPAKRPSVSKKLSPGVTSGSDRLGATVGNVPTGVKTPDGVSTANVRISPFVALLVGLVATKRIVPPESYENPP